MPTLPSPCLRRTPFTASVLALLVALSSCSSGGADADPQGGDGGGGGSGGGGGGGGETAGFSLRVDPGSQTVVVGGSAAVELQVESTGGFAGDVALDVDGLPAGIDFAMPESSTPAARTVSLDLVAASGAVLGEHVVTVRGVSGTAMASADFTLRVVDTPFDFGLGLMPRAVVTLGADVASVDVSVTDRAGDLPGLEFAVANLPPGFAATFHEVGTGGFERRLDLEALGAVTPGSVDVTVVATAGEVRRELSVLLHVLPEPTQDGIAVLPPAVMALRRGDTTAAEVFVDRATGVTGDVSLALSGLPAGMVGVFDDAPVRGAVSTLQLTAGPATPIGEHLVTISATDGPGAATGEAHVLVEVVDGAAVADFRVQRLELAQAYFAPDPGLVADRDTELRVHVLADSAGLPAPAVEVAGHVDGTALGTLPMSGPAFAPILESPANLDESFRATLPASWVRPGLELVVRMTTPGGPDREPRNDVVPLAPRVGAGTRIDLVVVPIRLLGRVPNLADYASLLETHWPLAGVDVVERAAWTPSSVTRVESGGTGWQDLLYELQSLRFAEGNGEYYYGVVPVDYGGGVAGIGFVGSGTALGWERTADVSVHELGHNFGLRHAPCGGVSGPDANYPFAGGAIGHRGYDPRSGRLVDPRSTRDLMGYCNPDWVSGYNFEKVRARLGGPAMSREGGGDGPVPMLGIQGRVTADGVAVVDRVLRAIRPWPGDRAGELVIRLTFDGGRSAVFGAELRDVGCGGTSDERPFFAMVPDPGGLEAVDVLRGGAVIGRVAAPVGATVAWSRTDAGVTVTESDGEVVVRWDAAAWPEVGVVHVGTRRTALGLRLSGGEARLDVAGLAPGGEWEIALGNGIAGRVERLPRDAR